jgi:hypothetical protein
MTHANRQGRRHGHPRPLYHLDTENDEQSEECNQRQLDGKGHVKTRACSKEMYNEIHNNVALAFDAERCTYES